MKKVILLAFVAICFCACTADTTPKVSIFSDHIEAIARQKDISFREAAILVKKIGYTGVDVWVDQKPEQLLVLKKLGFELPSAINKLPYCEGDQSEREEQTLEFMRNNACPLVLVVPGLMREGQEASDYETVKNALSSFSAKASGEGLTVMVEDYGKPLSPCSNTERIDGLLAAAPSLKHLFDSGNWILVGEDSIVALDHFMNKTAHVHLNVSVSSDDTPCPDPEIGCIPIKEIVSKFHAAGYDGWYTVELFGYPDMLEAARQAYKAVVSSLD